MRQTDSKGKVVSFKAARDAASSDARKGPEERHQPTPQPSVSSHRTGGGYVEVWHKAHTDKDALIKENLALKKYQQELEEEKQNLIPTLGEHIFYYASLLFAVGVLLGLIILAR